MSEPGGWHPNDKEVAGFRAYFLKGGFMIFDDFREGWGGNFDWTNLRQQVARALPRAKWVQLTGNEPIFHSFFDIDLKSAVVVHVGIRHATADVLGHLSEQRPEEAPVGDRQRRQRHRRVVAVVRIGLCPDRPGE